MALGTITVVSRAIADGTVRHDLITFAGDGAYATGGTAGFQASVRAALDEGNVEVLGVISQDCGGYTAAYDKVNDKLKVFQVGSGAGAQAQVANTTNLSATNFTLIVVSR